MDTLSILTPPHTFTRLLSLKRSSYPLLHHLTQTTHALGFCSPKSPPTYSSSSLRFRVTFQSPSSAFPAKSQLSDADEEEDEDEYEEDDDDEDVAADEYDDVPGDIMSDGLEQSDDEIDTSMAAAEPSTRPEEFKWQRVEKLCSEVKVFGEEMIDDEELASIYDFRIDKFQRLAIQAFLRGSSVVVSAPTSSGKTLIAEAAAVATVARGRRLFYTTPLKALSNQKFREFRETFGDDNVGLLTGDSAVNKDAQVLIMTTEILRNMLYQSVGMASSGDGLFHVDVIVLDEVHYLSDMYRGTVWEEIVIYCPKKVQLICLSATVANPDELAGWIGQIHGKTELVTSSRRPVPLTWHFSTKTSLLPLLDKTGKHMNRRLSVNYLQLNASGTKSYKDDGSRRRSSRRRASEMSYDDSTGNMSRRPLSKNDINLIHRSQVPQITDTLWHLKSRDMLPAIWFIFSRKGCDAAVQYVQDNNLLDDCEMSEVQLALKRFRIKYPDAIRETAVKGLLQGVAAHHAGCLPLWKSFIEELFQRGLVKVVFATETLAAGINMPARTAIIASLSKRSDSGRTQLSPNELFQMAGRAGRRGIDERGHVVLVQSPYEGAEACCKIVFAGLEPLVSQFTASYGMVLNLLAGAKVTHRSNESDDTEASQSGRTLEEARKLVEQSFGNYVGSNVMLAAKEELTRIQKEIEILTLEISDDAIDRKSRKLLSGPAYKEIADLQEELRAEKRLRTELRRRMESQKLSSLRPMLEEFENGHLPFLCLQYKDSEGVQHSIPAVYLGKVDSFSRSKLKHMVSADDAFALNAVTSEFESNLVFEPSAPSPPSPFIFDILLNNHTHTKQQMALKLHGLPLSTCTGRVLTIFHEKSLDFELVPVNLPAGEHKQPAFLAKNPFGQIPVLEDGDLTLFESRAITAYVAEKFKDTGADLIRHNNLKEAALVKVWTEVESQNFNPAISAIVFQHLVAPIYGMTPDQAVIDANLEKLAKVLDVYEARLSSTKYLAGDFYSLADLNHLPYTHYLMKTPWASLVNERPHVKAWWEDISSRPAFKKVAEAMTMGQK